MIHTASPFHYNVTDVQKEMLDPAINGTVGILKAIKKNAPSVKRVVITSSFAAMLTPGKPAGSVYSEVDSCPRILRNRILTDFNPDRRTGTLSRWPKPWRLLETATEPARLLPLVRIKELNSWKLVDLSCRRKRRGTLSRTKSRTSLSQW